MFGFYPNVMLQHKLTLDHRRGHLSTLLIIRQHHSDTITQGQVIPGDVKPLAALVGPDRADACPDFLTVLVFARVPAVVEDVVGVFAIEVKLLILSVV